MYKEYSYLDTLRNIGHYVFFNGTAYIFTDYGLIQIYGRSGEFTKVAKILTIDIWVYKEEYKDELQGFINSCLVEIPSDEKQKNLTVCTCGNYGIKKSKIDHKSVKEFSIGVPVKTKRLSALSDFIAFVLSAFEFLMY